MPSIEKLLSNLIYEAILLGLPFGDAANANEYIQYNEFQLCFETVLEQMQEFDIEINDSFYTLVETTGCKLRLPDSAFSYMKKLIRNESCIPQPVKDKLAMMMLNLQLYKLHGDN